MRVLVAWLCAGALAACFHRDIPHHPYPGWLPSGVHVDLAGTLTFSATGDLWLELVDPCDRVSMSMATRPRPPLVHRRLCDRSELDGVRVAAMTPWHQQVSGVWIDVAHLVCDISLMAITETGPSRSPKPDHRDHGQRWTVMNH